jgi:hypothetical protein
MRAFIMIVLVLLVAATLMFAWQIWVIETAPVP